MLYNKINMPTVWGIRWPRPHLLCLQNTLNVFIIVILKNAFDPPHKQSLKFWCHLILNPLYNIMSFLPTLKDQYNTLNKKYYYIHIYNAWNAIICYITVTFEVWIPRRAISVLKTHCAHFSIFTVLTHLWIWPFKNTRQCCSL